MIRVYIIIVNWNAWQHTVECLESLQLLRYDPHTVVLCDNGSGDDSLVRIRQWADERAIPYAEYDRATAEAGGAAGSSVPLVLVSTGANLGFAGGNNVGLRFALARADFSYAWLLNNDTEVDPEALTFLVQRMEQRPSAGMCGSTIRLYHARDRIQALGGGRYCRWVGLPWHFGRFSPWGAKLPDQSRAERSMNYVEGASMLVSVNFLAEIGLMCEDYFLYFEEADWAIRAEGRFELAYAPGSVVYHKVGASIGTGSNPGKKSYTCDYYNIRNRILFTRRYYPAALPAVYFFLFAELLLRLLLGKWDRASMIFNLMFRNTGKEPATVSQCPTES